ncbi:hypothetical protein LCGC14_3107610, partial [marine sediment metagenome]
VPTLKQWEILQPLLDLSLDYLPLIKRVEAEREIVGEGSSGIGSGKTFAFEQMIKGEEAGEYDITTPATDLAKQWEGHRYGLQALKPAAEPIIVFQKPYEGRPVDSITETGAGAINIDGGRIGGEPWKWGTQTDIKGGGYGNKRPSDGDVLAKNVTGGENGRWPANFVLTHSHDCQMIGYRDSDSYQINRFTDGAKPFGDGAGHEFESEEVEGGRVPVWECVDGCPVKALDLQGGVAQSVFPRYNIEKRECELCGVELIGDVNMSAGKKMENKSDNLRTDGLGSKRTVKSQRVTKYIILTTTNSITICPTCNLSRQNGMITTISDLEKTIKQLMELNTEDASVVL